MILLKAPASTNKHLTGITTSIYQPYTLLPVPAAWHLYANQSMALCPFNFTTDTVISYSLCAFNCVVGTRAKTDFNGGWSICEHSSKHCLGLLNVLIGMQLPSCARNSSFTDDVLLSNMFQALFSCSIQSRAEVIILYFYCQSNLSVMLGRYCVR